MNTGHRNVRWWLAIAVVALVSVSLAKSFPLWAWEAGWFGGLLCAAVMDLLDKRLT